MERSTEQVLVEHDPSTVFERVVLSIRDRLDAVPLWVLMIQAFIGLGWLRAGVEKAVNNNWWSGRYLNGFIDQQQDLAMVWYMPFLDIIVAPTAIAVSCVVLVAQLAIGIALLLGRRLGPALGAGMFLNLQFMAAGAVTPSVFYLLAQGAVVLWLAEQSRRGDLTRIYDMALVGGATLTGLSLPLIETLDLDEVIHDPAIMLATAGSFTAALAIELRRRLQVTSPRRPQQYEPDQISVGSR